MKKQIKLYIASILFCLVISTSALAGDTPISNIADGDTPISNVTVSNNSGPADPDDGFTGYLVGGILNFIQFLN